MATIFPSNPTSGDIYNGYSWDGTAWNLIGIDLAVDYLEAATASSTYQPIVSGVSSTEIGYLDGVTSAIQTQIDNKITASSADVLTNKTIGLGTGITSIAQYDNISGFFGQSNIAIYQAGLDKGGRINISSEGVITIANSGIGYTSGIVTTSGGTRLIITVGGNYLTGTLAEFNAALSDGNFATESYVGTAVSNLIDAAPATLDTLNELAAALGDDANFASTITASLGNKQNIVSGVSDTEIGYLNNVSSNIQTQLNSKAPSDSPEFTGNVTSDGSIRTSSFFKAQGEPATPAGTTSITLTIANMLTGLVIVTSSGGSTTTLPTGTLTDAGILGGTLPVNYSFDWVLHNTSSSGSGTLLVPNTGHTLGNVVPAIGGTNGNFNTMQFRTRKTATNTFVTYRIS